VSWLSDLLKGVPLNPVLRERLAHVKQRFKDMEAEIKRLKAENEELKRQIANTPVAKAMPTENPE